MDELAREYRDTPPGIPEEIYQLSRELEKIEKQSES